MTKGHKVDCPVCGANLPVGSLHSHVGAERCMLRLGHQEFRFADPEHGPKVFEAARALERALAAYRRVPSKGGE